MWNKTAYGSMDQREPHRCVDCGAALGATPGRDGDGLVPGVTFCPRCGAIYRWDFWRLNRFPNDTGSVYEPRLEHHGKGVSQ